MKRVIPSYQKLACFFICAGLAAGCGGTQFKAGRAWDPSESNLFDDGIDLVRDPGSLSGGWAYEQTRAFEGRLAMADFVAEVEILSLQTSSEMDEEIGKRIQLNISKTHYGSTPAQTLVMVSRKDSPGYALVLRYESHLNERFVLFVRWFLDEEGQLGHHFHLSPASEQVKAAVEKKLRARERDEALAALER